MRLIILRDYRAPRHRLRLGDNIDIDQFEDDEVLALYRAGVVDVVDDAADEIRVRHG